MRRGGWLAVVLILTVLVCHASLAAAADPHADKGGHGAAHKGDDSPFGGDVHQILDLAIWTVLVFLVLLFVLGRFAWKPMLAGLQKREDSIHAALAEAQKARDEAQSVRASLQTQMAEAHGQIRELMDGARRDAQALRDEELVKAKTEIQGERDRLRREIDAETDKALQRIWTQAADLATLASAKALGKGLDGDMQRRLIDEALADLKQAATRGGNGHA